jgi:hypothetical protein
MRKFLGVMAFSVSYIYILLYDLLEHLCASLIAYFKEHRPGFGRQNLFMNEGSIVSLIPKVPAAMLMTNEPFIACECSKYNIATTMYNNRLRLVLVDFQQLDDA